MFPEALTYDYKIAPAVISKTMANGRNLAPDRWTGPQLVSCLPQVAPLVPTKV